jgi:hypothetical protein
MMGVRTSGLRARIRRDHDIWVVEQRDRLDLGCGLSPTKRFSKAYGAGDTTQGLRYTRCDWRRMIRKGNASAGNSEFPYLRYF